MLEKRKQKKLAAGDSGKTVPAKSDKTGKDAGADEDGRKSGYRQRVAVDRTQAARGDGMDSVLGSVFG